MMDLPPDVFLLEEPEKFRALLLSWFDQNRRPLPWRRDRSLFGTWISEMMLQQTTVTTVGPYWERFLAVWPDVRALAAATEEEVLSLWSGLGYYRRARQLHAAARKVVADLEGNLPDSREGWQALPGVGPYAAGAIASIGLGQRVPALDANARRVLMRWLIADPESQALFRPSHLQEVGEALVDGDRPGDWNEAVMELGALVCRAKDPRCGSCPVRALCRASGADAQDAIPTPSIRPGTEKVQLGLLMVYWRGRILLMPPGSGPAAVPPGSPKPVRENLSGLHRGLWGLPATPWLPFAQTVSYWEPSFWRPFLETLPVRKTAGKIGDPVVLGSFRHAITRYRFVVRVYVLTWPDDVDLKAGCEDRPGPAMGPCFSLWPDPKRPVSNLVNKSRALVDKRSV